MILNKLIIQISSAILFFLGTTNLIAQQESFINSLSKQQLLALNKINDDNTDNNNSFKSTYSKSQRAIEKDKSLDRIAKKTAIRKTYSKSQKEKKAANYELYRNNMERFRNSLSESQKKLYDKHFNIQI